MGGFKTGKDQAAELVPLEIQDKLWRLGFTVMPRPQHPDPFHVDPAIIPKDRAYQWMTAGDVAFHGGTGWEPVPYERHPGVFGPFGRGGPIEVMGLHLMDKMRSDVTAEHRMNHERAHQNVRGWAARNAAIGLSGHVVSPEGAGAAVYDLGEAEAAETRIPADMLAYTNRVMRERGRLIANKMQSVSRALSVQEKGQCTRMAIDMVREQINGVRTVVSSTDDATQKGESNGNETPNDTGHSAGAPADGCPATSVSAGGDSSVPGENPAADRD